MPPDQHFERRFIALGDSGEGGNDQLAILKQLRTVPFQFMIHTGDIAYGSGQREELEQYFFDVYAPLLKTRQRKHGVAH